jgi:DNA-binding PadR family transcriptional regulator
VSATRLLILGAVRIFQPVHGYYVRRELQSWHVDEWAHLNPGSIYNALRTLTAEGMLREVATESADGRPARTTYELTNDGETEFLYLLRDALRTVDPFSPDRTFTAFSFAFALPREEVIATLESRVAQLEASHRTERFRIEEILTDPATPNHVAELARLADGWQQGELRFTRDLLKRIKAGAIAFAGEERAPVSARSAPLREVPPLDADG